MKLSLRSLSLASCAAVLLAAAPLAQAVTINGSVWEGGTLANVPAPGSPIYGTTPTATFTVTNASGPALLNFFLPPASLDVSLNGFLTTGVGNVPNGDTVAYLTGGTHSPDSINNDLFLFTGQAAVVGGTTYSFIHDDGMILVLNGTTVINSPLATSPSTTTFTAASSGTFDFSLYYAETFGAPAELNVNFPVVTLTSTVPEPSSFVLLGSGLLAAAGAVRRRFVKA